MNLAQQALRNTYADGDFAHVSTKDEARETDDRLFLFLWVELSDDEDCRSQDEALTRVDTILDDLYKLRQAIEVIYE